MPKWTLRTPDTFNPRFTTLTLLAFETSSPIPLAILPNLARAKSLCDLFYHWRFCIRKLGIPSSCIYQIEKFHRIALQTSSSPLSNDFTVSIHIRPKILLSLETLNPVLWDEISTAIIGY